MGDKTVFLSEYISEDTNPWDSRERFGIFTTFKGAAKSLEWLTKDYGIYIWEEYLDGTVQV